MAADGENSAFGPKYISRVLAIHDDYVDLLDEWNEWSADHRGEIQVWSTTRNLLIEAKEQAENDEDGELPDVGELLMHLNVLTGPLDDLPKDEQDDLWATVLAADIDPESDNFDAIRDHWVSGTGLIDEMTKSDAERALDDASSGSAQDGPNYDAPFIRVTKAIVTRLTLLEYQAQQLRLHLRENVPLEKDASPYVTFDTLSKRALANTDDEGGLGFKKLFEGEDIYDGDCPFWSEYGKLSYQQQLAVLQALTARLNETDVGRRILSELALGEYHDEFKAGDLYQPAPAGRSTLINHPASGTHPLLDGEQKMKELSTETGRAAILACSLGPGLSMAAVDEQTNATALRQEIGRILVPFCSEPADSGTDSVPKRLQTQQSVTEDEIKTFVKDFTTRKLGGVAGGIVDNWLQKAGLSQLDADSIPEEKLNVLIDDEFLRRFDSMDDAIGKIDEMFDGPSLRDSLADVPDKSTVIESGQKLQRAVAVFNSFVSVYSFVTLFTKSDDSDSFEQVMQTTKATLNLKNIGELIGHLRNTPLEASDFDIDTGGKSGANTLPEASEKAARANPTKSLQEPNKQLITQLLSDFESKINRAKTLRTNIFNEVDSLGKSDELTFYTHRKQSSGLAFFKSEQALERFRVRFSASGLTYKNADELRQMVSELERGSRHLQELIEETKAQFDGLDSATKQSLTRHWMDVQDDVVKPIEGFKDDVRKLASLDVTDTLTDVRKARRIAEARISADARKAVTKQLDDTERHLVRARAEGKAVRKFVRMTALQVAGALADVIDIALSFKYAGDSYANRDYSVAVGHALTGLGTAGMLAAALASGPAGWIFAAGALLVIGGMGLVAFTADGPLENWVKYSYYGVLRTSSPDSPENVHWGYNAAYNSALHGLGSIDEYWYRQMAGYFTMSSPFTVLGAGLQEDDNGLPKLSVTLTNVDEIGYGSVFLIRLLAGDPKAAEESDVSVDELWSYHHPLTDVFTKDRGVVKTWEEIGGPSQWSKTQASIDTASKTVQESKLHEFLIPIKNARVKIQENQYQDIGEDEAERNSVTIEAELVEDKSDEQGWSPIENLLGVAEEKFTRDGQYELQKYVEVVHVPPDLHKGIAAMTNDTVATPTQVAQLVADNPIAPRKRKQLSVSYSPGGN
ncbi:hypothetical protein [Natrinema marinum]|uniref:hypothetical protein n=1 Tax=Natrinema marinum TaxID=2961598 RepID=UPI0020C8C110|nr:hypothetical protein [Natrinema marinum]